MLRNSIVESFPRPCSSANLPNYGLPLDPMALRLCFRHGKDRRLCFLRSAETGRRQSIHRTSRRVLLHNPECLSLYTRPCDDRPLRAFGRVAETPDRSCQRDDGAVAADGIGSPRTTTPRLKSVERAKLYR